VHLEERGSTQDTEVILEAGDALGGAKWTWRRPGLRSEKHTWRTGERCPLDKGGFGGYTAKSAPGGYGRQADLTGTGNKAGTVSTVS